MVVMITQDMTKLTNGRVSKQCAGHLNTQHSAVLPAVTWNRRIGIALRRTRTTTASSSAAADTRTSAEERIKDVGEIAHVSVHASESTHTGPTRGLDLILRGCRGTHTFLAVLIIPRCNVR